VSERKLPPSLVQRSASEQASSFGWAAARAAQGAPQRQHVSPALAIGAWQVPHRRGRCRLRRRAGAAPRSGTARSRAWSPRERGGPDRSVVCIVALFPSPAVRDGP